MSQVKLGSKAASAHVRGRTKKNSERKGYPESANPAVEFGDADGIKTITIPHAANTSYLSHGHFRYIGKFPPQIVSWVLNEFEPSGPILDPMCGGGTTLAEARLRGIDAIGMDINPISREISSLVAHPLPADEFAQTIRDFLASFKQQVASDAIPKKKTQREFALKYCEHYFSEKTVQEIGIYLQLTSNLPANFQSAFRVALYAVLRHVSRANIKKMNLEIDDSKKVIYPLLDRVSDKLQEIERGNREYGAFAMPATFSILDRSADETGLESESVGCVFLHPPYLTNTAFCEFTQLQLAIMGIDHKTIWKRELRCRGSFLHEANGLRKYLTGWARIIKEAHRVLRPGGLLVTVVGDGQIDYVRIPVGAITEEFARDYGFRHVDSYFHLLNNQTGQTQSRKMKGQHVAIFRRNVTVDGN